MRAGAAIRSGYIRNLRNEGSDGIVMEQVTCGGATGGDRRPSGPGPHVQQMGISAARRAVMRANTAKNTKPELAVRRLLHAMGYRFRLHRRDLPGTPDIVFPGRRKVVHVHGCFWHQHDGCHRASLPATRRDYWLPKLARNKERDGQVELALALLGWETAVVWECELAGPASLAVRLRAFLNEGNGAPARPLPF